MKKYTTWTDGLVVVHNVDEKRLISPSGVTLRTIVHDVD